MYVSERAFMHVCHWIRVGVGVNSIRGSRFACLLFHINRMCFLALKFMFWIKVTKYILFAYIRNTHFTPNELQKKKHPIFSSFSHANTYNISFYYTDDKALSAVCMWEKTTKYHASPEETDFPKYVLIFHSVSIFRAAYWMATVSSSIRAWIQNTFSLAVSMLSNNNQILSFLFLSLFASQNYD